MTCHQVQKGMPCILKQTSQPSIPRQVHRIQHQSPKKAISTPYSLRDQTPLYNRHLLVQKLYLHNELGRLPHRITEVLLPPHGRPLRRAVYGIPSLPAPFRCTKICQGRLGRRGKTSGQTAGHIRPRHLHAPGLAVPCKGHCRRPRLTRWFRWFRWFRARLLL